MKNAPLPGHDKQPDGIICASCGHFVGALSKCPHCGAHVQKRLSVRATRYAAVLLATIGLFLLYWMAVSQKIPTIRISDITPTMNFAYVQVEGTVTRDTRIFKEGATVRSLRFDLNDGTGEIPVTAYKVQAEELIRQDKIPRAGDHVVVAGGLSVAADDRVMLRIQVADQVEVIPAAVQARTIAELASEPDGTSAQIEGVIQKVYAPKPGQKQPWSVVIADATGSTKLTFWDSIYADLSEKTLLTPGQMVRVRGTCSSYKDRPQFKLNHAADLEFLATSSSLPLSTETPSVAAAALESLTLDEISVVMKGKTIETEGTIVRYSAPKEGSKAPYRIVIQDGETQLTVVYWASVAEKLAVRTPEKGTRIQVRGSIDVFKDKPQLHVKFADQISFYQMPPAAPRTPPESTPIGDITKDDQNTTQTVTGTLGTPRSIKSGVIYPLRDKSGEILLLIWDRNIPGDARNKLLPLTSVTVTGTIKVFENKLEIIPDSSSHLYIH